MNGDESGLDVVTLGQFAVRWRGRVVFEDSRRRSAAVLKILLRKPAFRCFADAVAEELWPDSDPSAARANLRVRLHDLRRAFTLAEPAVFESNSIALLESGVLYVNPVYEPAVDALTFERDAIALLAGSERGETFCERAIALNTLCAGDYMPGEDHDEVLAIRERVRRLHRALCAQLVCWLLKAEKSAQALDILVPAFRRYPYDEALAELLFARLSLAGNAESARATFASHRDAVASKTKRKLSSSLDLLAREPVAEPAPGDSLIGRGEELAALGEVLERVAGGCGAALRILGGAASGKSALLHEIVRIAGHRGFATSVVRCYRVADSHMALEPVRSAIDGIAPPTSSRYPLVRTVHALASVRPCVIAIDDADLDERAFGEDVAALVRATTGLPILWLFAARARAGPAQPWLNDLVLKPLKFEDRVAIVEGVFGGTVGPCLAQALADLWPSDIRALVAAARHVLSAPFVQRGYAWEIPVETPIDALIPQALTARIEHSLSSLPIAEMEVLRAMSFVGEPVCSSTLACLSGSTEEEVAQVQVRLFDIGLLGAEDDRFMVPPAVTAVMLAALPRNRRDLYRRRLRKLLGQSR